MSTKPASDKASDVSYMAKAIIFVMVVCLINLMIPYATTAKLSVTVGEINATLKLWTFGYCLYLPNNLKDCSNAFLNKIGQFFF